jgi:cytidylate kinase
MPVITINGLIGSGTLEIGHLVAQNLGLNYVDRYIFSEAARLVGSPVTRLIEKEQRVVPFREKVARFMQTVLERSAVAGAGAEPYFGRGIEMLPAEAYTELVSDTAATSAVHDRAFIEATTSVINELAAGGDVVIIGRGSNMILADVPGVVHVGLVAPMDVRIDTMSKREMFTPDEAKSYAEELETARLTFYRKFFRINANDPTQYHLMLNIGRISQNTAAEIIGHASEDITGSPAG